MLVRCGVEKRHLKSNRVLSDKVSRWKKIVTLLDLVRRASSVKPNLRSQGRTEGSGPRGLRSEAPKLEGRII